MMRRKKGYRLLIEGVDGRWIWEVYGGSSNWWKEGFSSDGDFATVAEAASAGAEAMAKWIADRNKAVARKRQATLVARSDVQAGA